MSWLVYRYHVDLFAGHDYLRFRFGAGLSWLMYRVWLPWLMFSGGIVLVLRIYKDGIVSWFMHRNDMMFIYG